ncbi:MAG: patatin-like phospholipase family protein [Acidobacteria bacterium]|nr:patatin-like phospholipase family protein [Acidobacteriota bacterium]
MDRPILSTGVRELPKIALVLGTGGIKAMAGLALFEFFDEQKIPIDLLVGCSGGALACASIGMGHTPAEIREQGLAKLEKTLFSKLDYRSLLGIFNSHLGTFDKTSGILKPQNWKNALHDYFGDRKLEQLRPRTLLQTTDVDTGEGVVLTKGLVAEAVYASCAFFPAFPPIRIDGRYLGDGIYSAPVPVVEAIKRNMDVIIALDFKEKVKTEPKGFFSCFYRHIDNTMRTLTRSQMFLSIELHHHEIVIVEVNFEHTINPWDVHELPAIIEAGKKAVEEHKSSILSAITSFTKPRTPIAQHSNAAEAAEAADAGPGDAGKKKIKDAIEASPGIRRTVLLDKSLAPEDIPKPGRKDS